MGVVPVIYYSVLLGLGLPGEWQAGLWELGGGVEVGVLLRWVPILCADPETQNLRLQDTL